MLNADDKSADKTAANDDVLNFKNRRDESAECMVSWSCNACSLNVAELKKIGFVLFFAATLMSLFMVIFTWRNLPGNSALTLGFCLFFYGFMLLVMLAFMQKTVYRYHFSNVRGECESYLYFPWWIGRFFSGFVLFIILFLAGASAIMESLIPIVGVAVVGLGYGVTVMGWEREVTLLHSEPWTEYQRGEVDSKRKIIYLFSKGGAAFEIRLSTQESLGKCIMFLRTVLPESAAIKEDAGR
jgi:hypothetical protein